MRTLVISFACLAIAFVLSAALVRAFTPASLVDKVTSVPKKTPEKSITIVLNVLPSVKSAFLPVFKEFEQETGIKVIPQKFIEDYDFEEKMNQWLIEKTDTPDVLFGHNGMRLQKMAQLGAVHPITKLWKKNNWYSKFREEQIEGSSYENNQYALPYSIYTWGLFYKRSITEKLGPVPENWHEFKEYCQQLKDIGIAPFPASMQQPYIASAWFEYFVLRMHGLEFFNQTMLGEVSYKDVKIQQVLIEWQDLINRGFYDTSYFHMRWEEYLPYFLRDKIGFVLMGTPLASRIFDEDIRQQVDFIAFPKINDIPKYETAPSNVFFIASNSKKIHYSEQFLEFVSQKEIQNTLSSFLHTSPARLDASPGKDKYAQQGIASINDARGLSPFFDRGAKPEFEREAVVSFAKFLITGDVKQLTAELESLRLAVYDKNILSKNH